MDTIPRRARGTDGKQHRSRIRQNLAALRRRSQIRQNLAAYDERCVFPR